MRARRLTLGILAGNLVGALLCGLVYALTKSNDLGNDWVIPSLLLIPMSVGIVAAWIWSPLKLSLGGTFLHSLSCTFVALVVAVLIFREGAICLIILSPLLYAGILAGTLLGRIVFRSDRSRLGLWVTPLVVIAVISEPGVRRPHASVVVDELRIAAPPAAVWPHVLAFGAIPDRPDYWLFHLGLPYPTETTNGGNFIGADRACCFSGGAVFKEKVVEFDPTRRLTFDMIEMPPDPELLGHLDAQRGQFELRDNGDGTTTLIGRTWYSLHVRPAIYFDWWTHQIFSAVHLRVMRHIQRLAEAQP